MNRNYLLFTHPMARESLSLLYQLRAVVGRAFLWLQNSPTTGIAIGALVYYLLAKFGMTLLSLVPSNITLLWLPSGLAMIMCLQWGLKAVPWIALASFAANIDGMGGLHNNTALIHTSISALVDASTGVIAAALFKRYLPEGLIKTRDLIVFVFAVCFVTTLLTSIVLSANLYLGGYISGTEILGFIRMLILADSLGILLLYPIYQGWQNRFALTPSCWRWLGAGISSLLVVFVMVIMQASYAMFFILPILLLLAFNIKLLEIGIITAVSMSTIVGFTAADLGPLVSDTPLETNLRLMSFMFASSLTIVGIALQNHQLSVSEGLVASWKNAATSDPLTGILNRRAFFSISGHEVQQLVAEEGQSYSVAILDLDQFKCVNDTHGHGAGDLVLKEFAQLLERHCRSEDVPARIGGEEFAVFLPQCSCEFAYQAMTRIRTAMEQHIFRVNHTDIAVTVSIGVASMQSRSENLEDVMTRADNALYQAKVHRNTVISDDWLS